MSYKYPTREQAERIASETCGIQVCGHCDIAHWCVHDPNDNSSATRVCGESMLAMHDALDAKQAEIDRLRALVPKTIKPTIPTQDECSAPVICECGWIVAHTDEYALGVVDTDDEPRAKYCGQCGAIIDYTEIDDDFHTRLIECQ